MATDVADKICGMGIKMKDVILKLEGMKKSFGPTKAVCDVSMELHKGQVLALIGENGSGKSTLMSMVTGNLKPDGGTMQLRGKAYAPASIIDAAGCGICILIQELGTIDGLTVAENIFLGKESHFAQGAGISGKRMNQAADALLSHMGVTHFNGADLVDDLSFEERKLVEVCRAMYGNPDVLIVDETTTALSHTGRDKIYAIIKDMKKEGKAVVFISHDLDEVQSVCDSAMVLRDGCYIDTLSGDDVTPKRMRQCMIGRDLSGSYYREKGVSYVQKEVVLRAGHIRYGILQDVGFELHKGEILGLGGLTECGMHELCKIVFGAIKPVAGSVELVKEGIKITSPQMAIKHRIAYLPKDRDNESLFLMTSIKDNITVASIDHLRKGPMITKKSEKELADKAAGQLSVKMQNIEQLAKELSGGNKQKVVVAKWLANDSDILIMDCPTRGIDIGVKAQIYKLMEQLIQEGKSILMVSEEVPELLGMSDRILIMKDGTVNGEFSRNEQLTEKDLIEKLI